jgi:hypothetical protein
LRQLAQHADLIGGARPAAAQHEREIGKGCGLDGCLARDLYPLSAEASIRMPNRNHPA